MYIYFYWSYSKNDIFGIVGTVAVVIAFFLVFNNLLFVFLKGWEWVYVSLLKLYQKIHKLFTNCSLKFIGEILKNPQVEIKFIRANKTYQS